MIFDTSSYEILKISCQPSSLLKLHLINISHKVSLPKKINDFNSFLIIYYGLRLADTTLMLVFPTVYAWEMYPAIALSTSEIAHVGLRMSSLCECLSYDGFEFNDGWCEVLPIGSIV